MACWSYGNMSRLYMDVFPYVSIQVLVQSSVQLYPQYRKLTNHLALNLDFLRWLVQWFSRENCLDQSINSHPTFSCSNTQHWRLYCYYVHLRTELLSKHEVNSAFLRRIILTRSHCTHTQSNSTTSTTNDIFGALLNCNTDHIRRVLNSSITHREDRGNSNSVVQRNKIEA